MKNNFSFNIYKGCCCSSNTILIVSVLLHFRFKGNTVTSREGISEDTVLLSEQQHTGHIAKRTDSENRSPLSTGEYTLDLALEIHLNICIALLRVRMHYMANICNIFSNC